MNRKMLTAGWIMLALSAFLMTFMFEALVPRYYRYKKNQALVRAYRDVEVLDLSDLDDEAYDILAAYESENLFLSSRMSRGIISIQRGQQMSEISRRIWKVWKAGGKSTAVNPRYSISRITVCGWQS